MRHDNVRTSLSILMMIILASCNSDIGDIRIAVPRGFRNNDSIALFQPIAERLSRHNPRRTEYVDFDSDDYIEEITGPFFSRCVYTVESRRITSLSLMHDLPLHRSDLDSILSVCMKEYPQLVGNDSTSTTLGIHRAWTWRVAPSIFTSLSADELGKDRFTIYYTMTHSKTDTP